MVRQEEPRAGSGQTLGTAVEATSPKLGACSYAPWNIKLCLNGHEWAKRQLEKRGIRY